LLYLNWSNNVDMDLNAFRTWLAANGMSNRLWIMDQDMTNWQNFQTLELLGVTNRLSASTNLQTAQLIQSTNQTCLSSSLSNAISAGNLSNFQYYAGHSNLLFGISNAVMASGSGVTNGIAGLGGFLSNSFYSVIHGVTNGTGGTNSFDVASVTNNAT